MIVCDTSGIVAAIDQSQEWHSQAKSVLESDTGPILITPFVLAEVDYLLTKYVGTHAAMTLLAEVVDGAYRLETFESSDVAAAMRVMEKYRDLPLGLADASIVVIAARYRASRVLTLDRKHFQALRSPSGKPFQVLPEMN